MNAQTAIRLSKLMSLALRHNPGAFNLTLDENGWVALEAIVTSITVRPKWHWVQTEHVRHVVDVSDKKRFEIQGDNIRARYGHSRAARPTYQPVEPPATLYHGTPRRNLDRIRREGLQAMKRQYVHLSTTWEMAVTVGRRRDTQPALLRIRADEAHAAGIVFGTPSGREDDIYLVEAIPPEFIAFPVDQASS